MACKGGVGKGEDFCPWQCSALYSHFLFAPPVGVPHFLSTLLVEPPTAAATAALTCHLIHTQLCMSSFPSPAKGYLVASLLVHAPVLQL